VVLEIVVSRGQKFRHTDRLDMTVEFECRLDRRQAAAFLTARGYRTAPAALAKLACVGGGPTFESLVVSPYIARRTCLPGRRQKRQDLGGQQAIREKGRPVKNGLAGSQVPLCFARARPSRSFRASQLVDYTSLALRPFGIRSASLRLPPPLAGRELAPRLLPPWIPPVGDVAVIAGLSA
jgi:hypothetical protein